MMRAGPPQQLKVLVLLLVLLAHCICSCQAWRWPWGRKPKDISSAAKCRAASKGHVHKGDDVYDTLHDFFQVNGPAVHLPKNATDITTAATLIQLAVPELKLVLDPMLYLKAFTKPNHGIPKLIHMTTGSKHSLAPHQVLSIISWGWFNKNYTLLLYDDEDVLAYMKRYYPGFLPTFYQLKTSVEKSDAWRYHVLCGHGGVYADTDTICARSFDSWTSFNATPEPGLIVGVENLFHSQQEAEEASYVNKIQITQWCMASKRAHPAVCRMGSAIKAFVEHEVATGNAFEEEHGHDASILLRTGPGIWSKEVHSYLRQVGSSPEAITEGGQVEDLVVLPQAAFGCNFHYWNRANNESFVFHMFKNTWKKDHYKVADAKKAKRLQAATSERQQRQRQVFSGLGLVAVGGLLLLLYAPGWLPSFSRQLSQRSSWRRYGHRRRPHALAPGGRSPRSSPRGSPVSSPTRRSASSMSVSASSSGTTSLQLHGGRPAQQRQSAQLHLLNGTARKSARLIH